MATFTTNQGIDAIKATWLYFLFFSFFPFNNVKVVTVRFVLPPWDAQDDGFNLWQIREIWNARKVRLAHVTCGRVATTLLLTCSC